MSIILERPGITEKERELRSELVQRATDLIPLLQKNAAKADEDRRLPDENIKAIQDADLFRMLQPKRFGGMETDFRTKLEVIRELGRGCGSTSWTVNLLTDSAWLVGMWNEQAQNDVWGSSPDAKIAGVFPPGGTGTPVDGGYRVTGRWAYCSGCLHADWILLGIPPHDGDGTITDPGLVLIPATELTIEDTWFVAGMRGTGSNTVIAEDVFVPAHRFVSMAKLMSGQTDTPYKDEIPFRAALLPTPVLTLAAPQLGMAKAALDLVTEKAATRGISYTFYETQAQAPSVQLALAKAASLAETAELLAYHAAADIDHLAHQGIFPDYHARARIRMDAVQAIVYAREAIRELVSIHGASSFADSSPLQRILRDSEIGSRHAAVNPAIGAEIYGRSLLGITEGVSPLA